MATPITINIPHSLGKDEARLRIATGFERLQQQITGGMVGKMIVPKSLGRRSLVF
jgi:hypothetical protein